MNKDQLLIKKFYEDVEKLELRFPFAEIQKKTGESKGTVSGVLTKKREPSKRFLETFYKHYQAELDEIDAQRSLEKVSLLEKSFTENETFKIHDKPSIDKLLEAVIKQADNFTTQTSMLEKLVNTVASQQETIKNLTTNASPRKAGAVVG